MKVVSRVILILLLFAQAVVCYLKPFYNWDLLGYTGCMISIQEKNIDSIYSKTYEAAKLRLPAMNFEELIQSNEYRKKSFSDPDFFYDQLKLYWVKPLYILILFILNKTGISAISGTFFLSAFSLFCTGLLFYKWTSRYLPEIYAVVFSALIILSPPFWTIGRYSTPDALSALVILLSFYVLIEKKNSLGALIILGIGILIRIDVALFAFFTVGFMHFTRNESVKISLSKTLISIVIIAGITVLISVFAGNFTESLVAFYNYGSTGADTTSNYFKKLVSGFSELRYSHISLFYAILILSLLKNSTLKNPKSDPSFQIVIMITVYILFRYMIFPTLEDRFFIAHYLILTIMALRIWNLNVTASGETTFFH